MISEDTGTAWVNLRRRLPMYITSLRRVRPSMMTHSLQTRMMRKRKARLSCTHSASASVGREAEIVVYSQGAIYGRYWRGFFGSTRAWHCCRARPFLPIDPETSSQRQEERQGPKRNVRYVILRHRPFLTHALLSQRKVRRTPTAVSPTAAVCFTCLGFRQEPDRVASWLLRTSSRGTRLASR